MQTVAGLVALLVGAVGATLVAERAGAVSPLRRALLLAPFGVLMGAGAAWVRGWHLIGSIAVGAVIVPVLGVVSVRLRKGSASKRRDRVHGADW